MSRRRAAAVAGASAAVAAVAVGYAALAGGSGTPRSDDPGIAGSPSPTVSASPTPIPTTSKPAPGADVDLEPVDTASADVDGDGASDRVRLMVPRGTAGGDPALETWLEVRTSSTTATVQVTDTPQYVGFFDPGLPDLDGNGGAEVLVFESGGGESGGLTVWTWSDEELVRATPAPGIEPALVSATGLAGGGEDLGVAWYDDGLYTWKVLATGGHQVRVWRWAITGTTLTAAEQPGTLCIAFGVLSPC